MGSAEVRRRWRRRRVRRVCRVRRRHSLSALCSPHYQSYPFQIWYTHILGLYVDLVKTNWHKASIFRRFTAKTRKKCRFLVCALQSTNFVQISQKFVDAYISAIARQGSNMAAHPSFAHAWLAFKKKSVFPPKTPWYHFQPLYRFEIAPANDESCTLQSNIFSLSSSIQDHRFKMADVSHFSVY